MRNDHSTKRGPGRRHHQGGTKPVTARQRAKQAKRAELATRSAQSWAPRGWNVADTSV